MIIAITGTPGTGKTEVAKALAKRLGWWSVSLNDIAEEEGLYRGYDDKRLAKVVDMDRMREEVNILAISHKNMIIESHYAHEMPCDVVVVLRTDPGVLRKRMVEKKFWEEKIRENLDAEITEVIKDETLSIHRNVFEVDTTGKKAPGVAEEIENLIKNQTFITKDLKVPGFLLIQFRKPFGKVFKGSWDESAKAIISRIRGKGRLVIAVGDPTSYYLIKNGFEPHMIIIDGREKRRAFPKRIAFRHPEIRVKNRARHISMDLWKAVEDSIPGLRKERKKIMVKGEEDLAVLPCAIHAPIGSFIVYGQFGEGLVLVEVDKKKKERAKALLENIIFSQ